MQKLTLFFHNVLGIRDVSWEDIIEEIGWVREWNAEDREQIDFDRVKSLYQFMARSKAPKSEVKYVQTFTLKSPSVNCH